MPQFKSKFEVGIAAQFKKAGVKAKYEPHPLSYTLECKYIPDWILPNGIYIEAKGKLDAISRRKMLAVKAKYPEKDIRFVFQRAGNRLRKGSNTTYAQWADKHGFKWCEGFPPKEWFK